MVLQVAHLFYKHRVSVKIEAKKEVLAKVNDLEKVEENDAENDKENGPREEPRLGKAKDNDIIL